MPKQQPFEIEFDELALEHFNLIDPKYDSLLQAAIEDQLHYEPLTKTRNRKPLVRETATGTTWELRCGPNNRFRIFYKVDLDERIVLIIAVVVKIGNALYAGKERFEL